MASSTAALGQYPVTITGTSGTQTASTTITVGVYTPTFTVSTYSSVNIGQGTSGTAYVYVSPQFGFTGSVNLSVSGLRPTVGGLACSPATPAAQAANAGAGANDVSVTITAINGMPVAGHQSPGSAADTTVRRLLMLQGLSRPKRVVSLMSYPGSAGALTSSRAGDAIHVAFMAPKLLQKK